MKKKYLANPPRREEATEPATEELRELEKEVAKDASVGLDEPRALGARWLKRLTNHPILSHEETLMLARRVQGNPPDRAARERLIRCNMRLVVGWAYRKAARYRHLALEDLIQEGTLGLMRAVERFDPSRGFHLSTYAVWWIRHNIKRAIDDRNREIRLPVHMHEALARLRKVETDLTDEEAAHETGLTENKVRALRLASSLWRLSLDTPVGESGDATLGDFIPDEGAAPPDCNLERLDLFQLIAALPPRQRTVILLRLGETTLQSGGSHFGVTRERVRQIEAKAIALMRTPQFAARARRISLDDATRLIDEEAKRLFPGNEDGFWKRAKSAPPDR